MLHRKLHKHFGDVLHDLALQKESKILEGHLLADHVHMLVSIPPKYSVAQVVGFIKGKNVILYRPHLSGQAAELSWDAFLGPRLLCIYSGADEESVRDYIKKH